MRPNYFIFMGYLSKMRSNQQGEPPQLYSYEPPFQNPGSAPVIPEPIYYTPLETCLKQPTEEQSDQRQFLNCFF